MDHLLDTEHGLPTLLASLSVVASLHVFLKIGEFLWRWRENKDRISDETVRKLIASIDELKIAVSDLPKLKTDVRRYYHALKVLAGSKWPQVRAEILKEDELK